MSEIEKKDEIQIQRIQNQFLDVLRICRGNVGLACKQVKLDRAEYLKWLNDDRDFRFNVMVLIEEIGDNVEDRLMQKINEGDTAAILFYCKTKLKHRGYVEDQNKANVGAAKTKINVMVNLPENKAEQPVIEINENAETEDNS
jgi:hypothetical protein